MTHRVKAFMHKTANKKEDGFILVLTMIIVSISLAISFSTYSVSIKEVALGSYMRESERAFFVADRALECALFWDRTPLVAGGMPYTPFPTSTLWTNSSFTGANTMAKVTCNTGVINMQLDSVTAIGCGPAWSTNTPAPTPTTGTTIFHLNYSDGTCADVTVTKVGINTNITVNGYNTTNAASTRRTQRTIFASYNL